MEDFILTFIITGVICIFCGVYAARNAHKSYGLVLAGTYLFQSLAIAILISALMKADLTIWTFAIPLALGVFVYLAARLNFLWLWGSITLVCLVILSGIGGLSGEKIGKVISIETIGLCYLIGLIAAIVLRKHGRVLVVAISSGYNVGVGLLVILLAILDLKKFEDIGPLMFVIVLAGISAGIYYQYKVDRRLIDGVSAPDPAFVSDEH